MFTHNRVITLAILAAFVSMAFVRPAAGEDAQFCNAVQNRTGFIRYPLGAIGAWSTAAGESADVMTRVPRVYPCVNSVVVKTAKDDWRAAIAGDPSLLTVRYKADKPCGDSSAAITVSPHVTVFKVTFPQNLKNKYLVFDFSKGTIESWSALAKWTERVVTRIDERTMQATIGLPGKAGAYYVMKFSEPCLGTGAVDASGTITDGATEAKGAGAGMYARFEASTVTVAIAESFTSMARAEGFLASEFSDFETVHQRCLTAWDQVLNRVEIEGSDNSKRMAYTALYTMYANLINGDDGSCYLAHYPRPRSLASSAYWQFIGGFQSCCWDNWRTAYPLLCLAYPEVMTDVVNTYLARYQRDGYVNGNICLFTGPVGGHQSMAFPPVVDGATGRVTLFDKTLNRDVCKDMEVSGLEERGGNYIGVEPPSGRTLIAIVDNVTVEENNAIRAVIRINSRLADIPVTQRLTLYQGLKRLDIENTVEWKAPRFVRVQQLFPLAQPNASIHYGIPFGANAAENILPNAGTHASDEISNESWRRSRHIHDWIHAGTGEWGLTIASDHQQVRLGDDVIRAEMLRGTRFTSVKVVRGDDVGSLHYPPPGTYVFRYSLSSGPGDWKTAKAYRAGMNWNNPLLPVCVVDRLSAKSLPPTHSFCSVKQDNLVLSALKKSDQGPSVLLRLYEIEGSAAETPLEFLGRPAAFGQVNLLEEDVDAAPQQVARVRPYSIMTLKLNSDRGQSNEAGGCRICMA